MLKASKQVKHRSSMTEETWSSKRDEQLAKLHDEVDFHLSICVVIKNEHY